jgi:hypothetical protein
MVHHCVGRVALVNIIEQYPVALKEWHRIKYIVGCLGPDFVTAVDLALESERNGS